MRLRKITLRNFRCFDELEVDLHPRLTVLVGDNGAGKTAILDAIAIGLSPILRHLSSADQRLKGVSIRDNDFRLVSHTGRSKRQAWTTSDTAQIVVDAAEDLQWDVWRPSIAGREPSRKFGEGKLVEYLAGVKKSIKYDGPELTPVFAYYGARRGYIEIPERLRSTQESYTHPTSALVGALEPLSDFKEMLKWFDAEEANELRANKGLLSDDYTPSKSLEAVRAAIKSVLGGAFHNPHFSRDHKFVVESAGGGALFQVSQLSQGYQSMLALALDFARRLALGNPQLEYDTPGALERVWAAWQAIGQPIEDDAVLEHVPEAPSLMAPAVMLIDEVDLHLHPAWQQRVLADLMRTFPATQFIITTHSPQVLSTVRRENIRVLGKDINGRFVAAEPLAKTYGEPSNVVLQSVMHVDPQPPIAEKPSLQRLTALVDQGAYASDEALRLMNELTAALGQQHPQLLRLQRSIARQESLKR
ncbi:AAA family ATPase [Roseateles microcysteis]|uniref:AAA family ATPase n=1 Tax=Roseateles microcysteis TaxID=3119057 RepID=UPI002FE51A82